MKLSGNTVLITGGSSGIGLEMAKQFVNRNNRVIITGRNEEKLHKAQEQLKGVTAIQSDVSNLDDIDRLRQRIAADFSDLNVLINNAGIMRKINLQDHNYSALDLARELDINVKGPIWMTDAFLARLKEKREAAIVNVSSGLAFVPLPISPIYSSTKAALHFYTLSLREQLRNTNIKVFELAPPTTSTDMIGAFDPEDMDGFSAMSVEDMVANFIKGFSKDNYEIRPGLSNQLKFMSRLAPGFILKQLSKNVDRMHEG